MKNLITLFLLAFCIHKLEADSRIEETFKDPHIKTSEIDIEKKIDFKEVSKTIAAISSSTLLIISGIILLKSQFSSNKNEVVKFILNSTTSDKAQKIILLLLGIPLECAGIILGAYGINKLHNLKSNEKSRYLSIIYEQ